MEEFGSNTDTVGDSNTGTSSSFCRALYELKRSAKNLVRSESNLARIELKGALSQLGGSILRESIFGVLLVMSLFSFLAFLIIGLGRLLDNNFWLSALILSLLLALAGGGMAYLGFQKIKSNDLTLPRTRRLFQKGSKYDRF